MRLTVEDLKRYEGGEIEIQGLSFGYMYRGEVKSIDIEGSELKIKFSWLEIMVGSPPKWVKNESLDYEIDADVYRVASISPTVQGQNDRLLFQSPEENVIFYPKNGSKRDLSGAKKILYPQPEIQ